MLTGEGGSRTEVDPGPLVRDGLWPAVRTAGNVSLGLHRRFHLGWPVVPDPQVRPHVADRPAPSARKRRGLPPPDRPPAVQLLKTGALIRGENVILIEARKGFYLGVLKLPHYPFDLLSSKQPKLARL